MELSLDQHRLLESLGLGLMVLSVSIGLLSLWLNKDASQNRLPFAKPAMLLAMLLGVALLLLTILVPPHRAALPAPPVLPAAAALPAVSTPLPTPPLVATPAPEPPPALQKQPPASEAEPQLKVSVTTSAPKPAKRPPSEVKTPVPTLSTAPQPKPVTTQKVPSEPEVKPETAKESHKANIFSARCSRLLEKVGSGEPMSNAEQQEMVTKCQ
ncbi:MAG: hypothetical protein KAX57_01380 [Rhodoferax sp.]|uniref:hypothetical protein n=1 Tax=Rhodoferax sp. TaxID=50421 RepID=UPI001B7B2EC1|nr:hypothetical protein [Rhodoferax sp.]MBP8285469.1 hypothetical protein [Rhodoferax sp.]MBP9150238.1 hypothetical protein [Rhodoferax sp.]MBP9734968.1 hypothetical protein [Rhodoferax sp.]